jgi:hypothetical protein
MEMAIRLTGLSGLMAVHFSTRNPPNGFFIYGYQMIMNDRRNGSLVCGTKHEKNGCWRM